MTRGHADHSDEFDVVVSPGDVHFAAVWDDFVIKEQALISGMKFLMTLDPGNLPCPQLQLSFHFFRGNQTSVALSHHDTFFTWTAPILDEIHESMHSLILTFAKTMPPPDHYWFKLSMLCEQTSRAFLLAISHVKHMEARIEGPSYRGLISESPFGVSPLGY